MKQVRWRSLVGVAGILVLLLAIAQAAGAQSAKYYVVVDFVSGEHQGLTFCEDSGRNLVEYDSTYTGCKEYSSAEACDAGRPEVERLFPEYAEVTEWRCVAVGGSAIEVGVDIKPRRANPCIKINDRGVVPVAILGSDSFDVTQVDASSLTFAGLPVPATPDGQALCRVKDVSGDFSGRRSRPDGYDDLKCWFLDDADAWSPEGNMAVMTGTLHDGTEIEGSDEFCLK